MLEVVAKRYIKALIQSLSQESLDLVLKDLQSGVEAFALDKFFDIMNSPYLSKESKQDFLIKLIEPKTQEGKNFVRLLIENNRVEMIPYVYEGLQAYNREKSKTYTGLLYLNKEAGEEVLEQIKQSLSKKLSVDLEIKQKVAPIDGIKLVVDDLGIEVSFLKENFFNELKSYILRAI